MAIEKSETKKEKIEFLKIRLDPQRARLDPLRIMTRSFVTDKLKISKRYKRKNLIRIFLQDSILSSKELCLPFL